MALSVYVHVPFCASRCRYCAFYSGEPLEALRRYPERVAAEASLRARAEEGGPARTVYFGGGTPSLLRPRGAARVLDAVDAAWGLAPDAEVTLEANPGDPLDLAGYRAAGINRVSLGVQCLDDSLLRRLGRRHSAADALASLAAAAVAFDRVSADLLLGLPGLTGPAVRRWVADLRDAGAGHVSAYSLELHDDTSLAKDVARGAFACPSPAQEDSQWAEADAALSALGLAAYEVSNYCRPGHECRHNLAYWDGAPYLGLGPGAHSFAPSAAPWGRRSWNATGLTAYEREVAAGRVPPGGEEILTAGQSLLEALFLALRRPAPAHLLDLAAHRGFPTAALLSRLAAAELEGLLVRDGPCWTPTREGLRRADGLALWLCQATETDLLP